MKTLYVVRHAIAADPGPSYPTDASRPLTEEGMDRWRAQVRGLRGLDVSVDAILTSPLIRCRQTAEILGDGLDGRPGVEVLDALRPGGRLEDVLDGIAAFRAKDALALVGHEPSIGAIAAALIGAPVPIPFKKGAVCRVDVPAFPPRSAGTLIWMLPPRVMRKLGE